MNCRSILSIIWQENHGEMSMGVSRLIDCCLRLKNCDRFAVLVSYIDRYITRQHIAAFGLHHFISIFLLFRHESHRKCESRFFMITATRKKRRISKKNCEKKGWKKKNFGRENAKARIRSNAMIEQWTVGTGPSTKWRMDNKRTGAVAGGTAYTHTHRLTKKLTHGDALQDRPHQYKTYFFIK